MRTTYHFNQFLLLFLFALVPLHAMEINPSNDLLTQFFDAIKACDVQTVQTILKKHPAIVHEASPVGTTALEEAIHIDMHSTHTNAHRPLLVKLLLKAGAQIKKTYLTRLLTDIQGHTTCKNQIAHLLFSFGAAMDSDDDRYYTDDPESILRIWEREHRFKEIDNTRLIIITQKHICTRLYIAIKEDNTRQVCRLVRKYNLAINKPLPCYFLKEDYGTPSALVDIPFTEIIPLHYAVVHKKDVLVRILVDDLHADVNATNENGQTVFHYEPNDQTVEFLVSKGAHVPDIPNIHNQMPMDSINLTSSDESSKEANSTNSTYTDESSSEEIEDHVESDEIKIAENFHTPDINFEEYSPVPTDNLNTITSNYHNHPEPDPVDDPPHVITNGTLPWKWIGGGFAVIIVIISAKKLYNWWHTTSEQQEEIPEDEAHRKKQPLLDVRVLKNTF